MARYWNGFFWGPPSHKRVAWVGAAAGVGVIALAGVLGGSRWPLFGVAVLLVGLAEFGWAAELLPARWSVSAGWARAARWVCALAGTALSALTLWQGMSPAVWLGAVITGTGVLLAWEMAPSGPANRPRHAPRHA